MRNPLASTRVRVVALLLVAVLALGALLGPGLLQRYRARELTPVMRRYVTAAVAGDSTALEAVSATEGPVRWALQQHREHPALLELASGRLAPTVLGRMGSGAVRVHFGFAHHLVVPGCAFPYDGIYAAFRKTSTGWRLIQAGIGPC